MKSGSNQFKADQDLEFCSMCGAVAGDYWQTRPIRPVLLRFRPRFGDITHRWTICDECDEGLRNLNRRHIPSSAVRRRLSISTRKPKLLIIRPR